ncbi:hypothetical protein M0813_00206 [Anaeramoeba flamelloides]|uniref:Uncharacterized protein n=1 Tax=Anaeramoeba flamelloides TaxID=1746091 RepID=A0ABQ8YWL7_9EUKA|nr:hypothetical protein M0813_00206 [Anaeramoeba flamelloides]
MEISYLPFQTNEFGTPLLREIFRDLESLTKYKVFCMLNPKLVFTSSFPKTIKSSYDHFGKFLAVGNSHLIPKKFKYNQNKIGNDYWQVSLLDKLDQSGVTLQSPTTKEYFIFSKSLFSEIPGFAFGRKYWEDWLFQTAILRSEFVIDLSETNRVFVFPNIDNEKKEDDFLYQIECQRNEMNAGELYLGSTTQAQFESYKDGQNGFKFRRRFRTSFFLLLFKNLIYEVTLKGLFLIIFGLGVMIISFQIFLLCLYRDALIDNHNTGVDDGNININNIISEKKTWNKKE